MILEHQAPSGAYIASPSLPTYRYSWLRDGAFIADAMSRAGETESAEAFFGWCARILEARSGQVEELVERHRRGDEIARDEHLHCRYTVDGAEYEGEWSSFQLDGYGSWLWALGLHARRHGASIEPFAAGAAPLGPLRGRVLGRAVLRLVGGALGAAHRDARLGLWRARGGGRLDRPAGGDSP